MKNIAILTVLVVMMLGCDLSKLTKSAGTSNSNSAQSPTTPMATATPAKTPAPEATVEIPSYVAVLKKSAGKYPSDIKLLDIDGLKERLQKLLGNDMAEMKAKFDVEMPNEIEDSVFKGEACEAHNCGANRYIIYVDLKDGNINVYHVRDEKTKKYLENGEIKLPEKFAKDLAGG